MCERDIQTQTSTQLFIFCSGVTFYTFSTKSPPVEAPADQQGHGLLASCSTVSPLLRRNASCLGSRPRKFFNISAASAEPPGCRMNFL